VDVIDLRSDTVTRPTPAMRRAMAEAEVGDDVLGDDPTVRRLEERTAELLGKEAALFVPSGTMANEIAVCLHVRPGDAVVCDADCHVHLFEGGAPAVLAGASFLFVAAERGVFTGAAVERTVHTVPGNHGARPALAWVENTHNLAGGRVWPVETLRDVAGAAHRLGLAAHMDGARVWNAAAALGLPESVLADPFDSVSACFSKGLGAPVGSAIAGSAELIREARRVRQRLGGGMRQAGILAAGALYALEHHRQRLVEDHIAARRLAEIIAGTPGLDIQPEHVETNLVYIGVPSGRAHEFVVRLRESGVLILPVDDYRVRAVTSLEVSLGDVECAAAVMRETARAMHLGDGAL